MVTRRSWLGAAGGALLRAQEGVDYFGREELDRIVPPAPMENIPFEAVAYHFPAWHPSPPQEKFFGQGWTEYETMRRARPLFDGHLQPKRPLWGCFNEADPAWSAREIDAAAGAGISAFVVDWYWRSGMLLYHEQLEEGFLRAPNRDRLRFAIMWANHDWLNLYPAPEQGKAAVLYPQEYSEPDMERLADYLAEHYLRHPNYWRIAGQPVFAIFDADHLLAHFGPAKLRRVFDLMRKRTGGLHIQASKVYTPGKTPLREAGFDSATDYHPYAGGAAGKTSTFAAGARKSIQVWQQTAAALDIPYFPDCAVGWDNSPRFGSKAHVFTGRTPDQYEALLVAAKRFLAARRIRPPAVYLSAWNEWTEDQYLLPDNVHGYGYLEAVRRQFGRAEQA